ncbi:MAG: NAD(P)-dependent alcohol dehydrogenase [Actinomycetota bacterium]|nr:NAD(P)-dependent alcohol dehydrogenase [Actinomycetota bacterium]
MKAIVQAKFGSPETLQLLDIEVPEIAEDEVLVRMQAASLNPADWHIVRGEPRVARLMGLGLTRPKNRVAGIDGAGIVEAIGTNVQDVRVGDEVFGFFQGSFAEFAVAEAGKVTQKPAQFTFQQAAALPIAATTGMRGIRDIGEVQAGQRVLINGAAGGVGTFALQIAVALGAEVSGVSSARNGDLLRSLGAAHVIDYAAEDFTLGSTKYHVILDNTGNHPLGSLRRTMVTDGILLVNSGGSPGTVFGPIAFMASAMAVNVVVRQRLRLIPTRESRDDLRALDEYIDAGQLAPVVDKTYALTEVVEGLRVVEGGHARGKLVIAIP